MLIDFIEWSRISSIWWQRIHTFLFIVSHPLSPSVHFHGREQISTFILFYQCFLYHCLRLMWFLKSDKSVLRHSNCYFCRLFSCTVDVWFIHAAVLRAMSFFEVSVAIFIFIAVENLVSALMTNFLLRYPLFVIYLLQFFSSRYFPRRKDFASSIFFHS